MVFAGMHWSSSLMMSMSVILKVTRSVLFYISFYLLVYECKILTFGVKDWDLNA